MFQPQSCRFMLYGPLNKIINDQLQSLPFDPISGVQLSFQCSHPDCHQSVTIEIDSGGNLSKLSVIDPDTNSANMIYDFSRDVFIHYRDSLDLICGHPLFHVLQQTTAAHYQAGHYTINVTPL
jgi:hypothetical protein